MTIESSQDLLNLTLPSLDLLDIVQCHSLLMTSLTIHLVPWAQPLSFITIAFTLLVKGVIFRAKLRPITSRGYIMGEDHLSIGTGRLRLEDDFEKNADRGQ